MKFGHYVGGEKIGAGASSIVYAVQGAELALKTLQPNTSDPRLGIEQLLTDGVLRTLLQHPSVLPCLDFGVSPAPYTVSRRVHCEPLFSFIARVGVPTGERAERWSTSLLSLVGGLFNAGVVLHDLTPQNLLLQRDDHQPVLIDLGIVSVRRPALAQTLHALTGAEIIDANTSKLLAQARQLFRLLFFALTGCDAVGEWAARAQDRHAFAPRIPAPLTLNPKLSPATVRHLEALMPNGELRLVKMPEWLDRAGVTAQTIGISLPTLSNTIWRDAIMSTTSPRAFLAAGETRTAEWMSAALAAAQGRIWHVLPASYGGSYVPLSFGYLQGFLARDVDGDRVLVPEQMQRLKHLLESRNERLLVVVHDADALDVGSRERLLALLQTPALPVVVLLVTREPKLVHADLLALLTPA